MCGIYGIIPKKISDSVWSKQMTQTLKILFEESLSRGSEATGLAISTTNELTIHRSNINCKSFLVSKNIADNLRQNDIRFVFGQTRMATNGSAAVHNNNQPVISNKKLIVGVHNGIITNHKFLRKKFTKDQQLDTQILLDYLEEKIFDKKSPTDLLKKFEQAMEKIEGTANLALLLPTLNKFILYSNHGSLYFLDENETYFFASERNTLKLLNKHAEIKQLRNQTLIINLNKSIKNKISLVDFENQAGEKTSKQELNSLEKLHSHRIDQLKINAIPRCTKCILPNTTPFISFNELGICNYCSEHQKIKYAGRDKIENILDKHRRSDGRPDCLVAFSGGRDSSYGLHLIKKELGMNPLAFTYDWGMISDLGRRNQARMLAKLETEYILVSADIAKKRKHIRQNILAWIRKPSLGMVPIFMQGDKQCEHYADQVMKKYNIPLMIYCRGNELEKEEFKAGYCGIKEADPGGVIHNLSASNKAKLLGFYAKEYMLNPAYINESIFDTAFGYFSTYMKPHNYLYLWHYLPWNENEIVDTLTKQYDWELSDDTPASWRIGDGTPAFYNYIYYQVQGFTENDSLRSRQVREGIITRDQALKLATAENQVQYKNLKWYFDTLNLDGHSVLNAVDKMEKKYKI